ncbi:hypothetical protein PACTADRAFT_23729, partial [Pachysolen tannophilus NRRL Y-2460]
KRKKTFSGCWTCRSRKVKCDTRKPSCLRCEKSGFTCGGYEIKLRWSNPVKFDKYGNQLSTPHSGDESLANNDQHFQRRTIDFVRFPANSLYETYEDIDRHLAHLHNSNLEKDEIKKLGPFSVFATHEADLRAISQPAPSPPTTVAGDTISRTQNSTPSAEKTIKSTLPSAQVSISNRNLNPSDADLNFFGALPNSAQGNEWLSNELINDALLTVSALNGDTHFLDFFNINDMSNGNNNNNNLQNQNQQQLANQDEMFNLLFHRKEQNYHSDKNFKVIRDNEIQPTTAISLSTPPDSGGTAVSAVAGNKTAQSKNNKNTMNSIMLHAPDGTSKMPSTIMEIIDTTPLPASLAIDKFCIPATALQVNPMTRYLLNYYIEEVADMMTVIPLPKNPWKFIYFPRALMAVGELGSIGKTSHAKNCLLNALLAVSAFNLQSKFTRNSDEMKVYLNLGIQLRQQATIFLKHCLLEDVLNQKYKDVLVAVLSMVTIDIVWGTMSDCKLHLDICEKLIAKKMKIKKKLSSKAKILHRIFSNLKLIQDSTSLDKIGKDEIFLNDSNYKYFIMDHGLSNDNVGSNSDNKNQQMFSNHNTSNNLNDSNYNYITSDKLKDNMISSDAIYGLPNSLILLFSEIVHLVRFKRYHDDENLKIPEFFYKLAKELEFKLSNWKLEWKLYDTNNETSNTTVSEDPQNLENKKFLSKRHEGIYHHVLSFYHGLIIYFHRMVNNVNPMYLQEHVEKVLIHLNLIQAIVENKPANDKNLLIIPLFWQGFIAGSEAMTVFLQNGFKNWGTQISKTGIGSYWVARQIMLEVWRRKNFNEKRNSWCNVIKDWEMNVML